MSDEHKLLTSVDRAARAESLLSDSLVAEAVDRLEADYLAAWRDTDWCEAEQRERIYMAVTLLGKVRGHLKRAVIDGKLARAELDQIAQRNSR